MKTRNNYKYKNKTRRGGAATGPGTVCEPVESRGVLVDLNELIDIIETKRTKKYFKKERKSDDDGGYYLFSDSKAHFHYKKNNFIGFPRGNRDKIEYNAAEDGALVKIDHWQSECGLNGECTEEMAHIKNEYIKSQRYINFAEFQKHIERLLIESNWTAGSDVISDQGAFVTAITNYFWNPRINAGARDNAYMIKLTDGENESIKIVFTLLLDFYTSMDAEFKELLPKGNTFIQTKKAYITRKISKLSGKQELRNSINKCKLFKALINIAKLNFYEDIGRHTSNIKDKQTKKSWAVALATLKLKPFNSSNLNAGAAYEKAVSPNIKNLLGMNTIASTRKTPVIHSVFRSEGRESADPHGTFRELAELGRKIRKQRAEEAAATTAASATAATTATRAAAANP